jgi:uncharacterized protein (TIGR03382 family)
MKKLVSVLGATVFTVAFMPLSALAQGAECSGGLCGTPNQSGGGCGCGCGSVLVAMTDRGDTYQFADDFDGDGIEDEFDNCPFVSNYVQADVDADNVGDACDVCVNTADPAQSNIDGDGFGDLCDSDMDNDGQENDVDNCVTLPNADQTNTDGDSEGDACDADDDNDGVPDISDDCRLGVAGQDVCDDDQDGDGVDGSVDNCPGIYNPELDSYGEQLDMDEDGIGDLCDSDIDGDEIENHVDNCVEVANPSQLDVDRDGRGDAGNWTGGDESCDSTECYVISGDTANCLDPNSAFAVYLQLQGERENDALQTGTEITVALFSNRLGQQHSWTARFDQLPSGAEVSLENAQGSGASTLADPQVVNSVGNITFIPDQPGEYTVKVTASLPGEDTLGPSTSTYTIVAEVEGEAQGGGCAATSGGFAALALGLLVGLRRRRK